MENELVKWVAQITNVNAWGLTKSAEGNVAVFVATTVVSSHISNNAIIAVKIPLFSMLPSHLLLYNMRVSFFRSNVRSRKSNIFK